MTVNQLNYSTVGLSKTRFGRYFQKEKKFPLGRNLPFFFGRIIYFRTA